MREIQLSDGRKITVRAMTRKELRDGKQLGFGSMQYLPDIKLFDQACDYALGKQFAEEDLDGFENQDLLKLYNGVLKETYGDAGEEKNSPTSGPIAQTKSESSAAANA